MSYLLTLSDWTSSFSLSQELTDLAQLLLATELGVLGPPFVVHSVEGDNQMRAACVALELDHSLDLVGVDPRDEVGSITRDQPPRRVDHGEADRLPGDQAQPGLRHVLDLLAADRPHHVDELAARTEVELCHLGLEPVRAHDRLDSPFCGQHLPDLLG